MKSHLIAVLVMIASGYGVCAVAQEQSSTWEAARAADLHGSWGGGLFGLEDDASGKLVLFEEAADKPTGIWDSLSIGGATAVREESFMRPWESTGEEAGTGSPSLSFNQNTEYGVFNLETRAGDNGSALNISHSQQGSGWIKGYETGVQSDQFQTLLTVGARMSLAETEYGILASRVQAGYGMRHVGLNDTFHGAADLFFSRPLMDGRHWVKVGGFIDQEREFGKAGPELGFLFNAYGAHPVTLDVDYCFGLGSVRTEDDGASLTSVGSGDLQTRLGTFIHQYQVGATVQHLTWDNGFNDETWELGGFVNVPLRHGSLLLDFSTGENGIRGMANLVLYPGSWRTAPAIRTVAGDGQLPLVHVQNSGSGAATDIANQFAYAPVLRSTQIRTASKTPVNQPVAAQGKTFVFTVTNGNTSGGESGHFHSVGAGEFVRFSRGGLNTIGIIQPGTAIVVCPGASLGVGPATIITDGIPRTDVNGHTYETSVAGSTINGNPAVGCRVYAASI